MKEEVILRLLGIAMAEINKFQKNKLTLTEAFILDSFKEIPIGETENFVWFITDIGIAALLKKNGIFQTFNQNVENEAKNISLDISKEEKEYFEIEDKKIFLFYS